MRVSIEIFAGGSTGIDGGLCAFRAPKTGLVGRVRAPDVWRPAIGFTRLARVGVRKIYTTLQGYRDKRKLVTLLFSLRS